MRAQLGRQMQGELAQRALVRRRAVESATAIVHTYQRGHLKREALRDALEHKVVERRRQRALEHAVGVVGTVTRRYQEGRATRRQLLESFGALVEAGRERDARRRAEEVSTALGQQVQARRSNEVLLGDELSARVAARREREARLLAEAAATLIARHARGTVARAGFGERMSGLLARRQERQAQVLALSQREVSAVVIARYQRGREVRARMGELLQQRVNAKQIHRAAGLEEKSNRRERLDALTKGRHHPKPKLAKGTSLTRGQPPSPTRLPPLVTGGLGVVDEAEAEGGCPAEWRGLCAQREAVIARLMQGAHRLAHCVATDDPSAARRAFCKDLAALRLASLALAEVPCCAQHTCHTCQPATVANMRNARTCHTCHTCPTCLLLGARGLAAAAARWLSHPAARHFAAAPRSLGSRARLPRQPHPCQSPWLAAPRRLGKRGGLRRPGYWCQVGDARALLGQRSAACPRPRQ